MSKITIDRTLLEQALEALERPRNAQSWYQRSCDDSQAAKALREALARPAQQKQAPSTNCDGCANADSWGLPDKALCKSCVGGNHWQPLNKSSVNMNTEQPARQEPAAATCRDSFMAGYEAAQADAKVCDLPPPGWHCTRHAGHGGPCAAVETDDRELVANAMKRLAEHPAQQELQPVQEPVQVWCDTCEGSGSVHQEHQAGCHVGGIFDCPDCDGKGFVTRQYTSPQAQPAQQEPVAKLGMYEHKCTNVTGHRGPSFVCQKAGHGVSQNSYCKDCTCPDALSASPQTQQVPESEVAAAINETNSVLAGRYFDLLKVVEAYEKHGVTCQTFRHFVDAPCAECNCTSPQAQPLSNGDLAKIYASIAWNVNGLDFGVALARAIEQAHGITKGAA